MARSSSVHQGGDRPQVAGLGCVGFRGGGAWATILARKQRVLPGAGTWSSRRGPDTQRGFKPPHPPAISGITLEVRPREAQPHSHLLKQVRVNFSAAPAEVASDRI